MLVNTMYMHDKAFCTYFFIQIWWIMMLFMNKHLTCLFWQTQQVSFYNHIMGFWTSVILLHILVHTTIEFLADNWSNTKFHANKGQVISKWFLGSSISSKKRTKTRRIVVKMNSFVRFLDEIDDPKNHFEINWPLVKKITWL